MLFLSIFFIDSVSYLWKSCKLEGILNKVTIIPNQDITEKSKKFKLELTNIHYPSLLAQQYTISASLIDATTTNVISSISGVKLQELSEVPKLSFPQIVIQKYFSTLSFSPIFLFNFTTESIILNQKSVIYITFPEYYSPKLTHTENWKELTCILNNYQIVSCSVEISHTLRIYNFPVVIPAAFPFSIKVIGVQQPFHGYTIYRPFSFRILANKDETNVNGNMEIADASEEEMDESSYGIVSLLNVTLQTNIILVKNSMTFSFTLPYDNLLMLYNRTTDAKTPRYVVLDLPSSFIYYKPSANVTEYYQIYEAIPTDGDSFSNNLAQALGMTDISTVITQTNYRDFYSIDECDRTFSFAGKRFIFKICHTLFKKRIYTITIPVVKNPQCYMCHIGQFFLAVASQDLRSFDYVATELSINLKETEIVKSDYAYYWKWRINENGEFRDVEDKEVIKLYRGAYTNELMLMLENEERLSKNVYFKLVSYYSAFAEIKMYPEIPEIQMGSNRTSLRIGCSKTTFPGFYQFFFKSIFLTDELFEIAYFNEPPPLDVLITDDQMPIDISSLFQDYTVQIPIGGISLPLLLDTRYYVPYEKTKILASYPIYPDIGADFADNAYLVFSVQDVFPFLILRCYEQFNYLLDETTLSLNVSSNDSSYYKIINSFNFNQQYQLDNQKQSITVKLTPEIQTSPLLEYTVTNNSAISTQVNVTLTTNQSIFIFWSISYQDYPSNSEEFSTQSFIFYSIYHSRYGHNLTYINNANSKYEEQIGRWVFYYNSSISQINQTKLFKIENLRANKAYYLRMIAKNLAGTSSPQLNAYFVTPGNNNDRIQRVKVVFNRNITRFELSQVACAFCAWFDLPWYKVRSLENITCNLQNQTYEAITTPISEDYIDPSVLIPESVNNNTYMTYLYSTNYFYLSPFDELENSYETFQYIQHYTSYRINAKIGYLTEKFNLLLASYNFQIQDVNYAGLNTKESKMPDLASQQCFVISNNESWVRIANISSVVNNASGILLAVVKKLGTAIDNYRDPKTSDYPTYQQIADKKNADGITVPFGHFSFGLFYENNAGLIEFFNLEPLTKYQVFYTSADEDPTSFFREGNSIQYMIIQTQTAWMNVFQFWQLIIAFILIGHLI